jgi:hypothetical protein
LNKRRVQVLRRMGRSVCREEGKPESVLRREGNRGKKRREVKEVKQGRERGARYPR